MSGIEWSRDRSRNVTQKGQSCDLVILDANILKTL